MALLRLLLPWLATAALAPVAAPDLLAQVPSPAASTLLAFANRDAGLASEYRVTLRSMWPAYPGAPVGCGDPGTETLEGTFVRVGETTYRGRFERTSILRFCGPHGPAASHSCAGALEGAGAVDVQAEVTGTGPQPAMSLEWIPIADSTRVRVRGDCPDRFLNALQGMYRSTAHGVEFELSAPASGGCRVGSCCRTMDGCSRSNDLGSTDRMKGASAPLGEGR